MLASLLGRGSGCLTTPASAWLFELLALERSRPVSHADILRLVPGRFPPLWGPSSQEYLHTDPGPIDVATWFKGLIATYAADLGVDTPVTWISHAPPANRFLVSAASMVPDAVIVHIVRDGRAVYASLNEFRPVVVASPRQAALIWRERLCFALAAEHNDRLPDIVTVRFEDLVTRPEATLGRLATTAGIELPSDATQRGTFRPRTKVHQLVGEAPDPTRVDAWRTKLTSRQIELFEYYSDELLEYFGYETVYGPRASAPSHREWMSIHVREFARPLVNAAMTPLTRRRQRAQWSTLKGPAPGTLGSS